MLVSCEQRPHELVPCMQCHALAWATPFASPSSSPRQVCTPHSSPVGGVVCLLRNKCSVTQVITQVRAISRDEESFKIPSAPDLIPDGDWVKVCPLR